MKRHPLYAGGPDVGVVGLGCMGMSWAYTSSEQDDDASREVLAEAVDLGVTFFDTADVYGLGANERLVGPALAPYADRITLATKCGLTAPGAVPTQLVPDGRPEHIAEAIDASLQRLGRDHVDLYYLHRVDPAVPLADSWGAMAEVVAAGKAVAIGMSEVSVAQLTEAQAIHPVAAVQSEFSLWTRDPAGGGGTSGDVVSWTAEHGAAFVPFAPLGRGYLTGAFDAGTSFDGTDFRARNPRFSEEALAANQGIVDSVRAIAAEAGASAAQVAIAWVLAQGDHITPIPGTKRSSYLRDNTGAADVVLTADQVRRLSELPAAVGSRY